MKRPDPATCQHKWVTTKQPDVLQCLWGCGATKPAPVVEDDPLPSPVDEYEASL